MIRYLHINKNMEVLFYEKLKKQFLAAVLTAVMAVCAFAGTTPVAAATLSAKQYINKMAKATEKLKSYEMKMNMDMDMSVQGKPHPPKPRQQRLLLPVR